MLVYKKYLVRKNETISSVENKKYLGQLRNYLTDCPSILSKLQDTKYTKSSLEKLFLFYYSCTQSGIQFQKKTEKITMEAGLFAGLTQTSLTFGPFALDFFEKSHYTRSANVTAGLFADFIFPGNGKKWSIYNEVLYTSYNIKGYLNEYVDQVNYEITNTTISYSYLKLNNMFRFKYPVGKMHIYANIGMSNGYAVAEINYKKIEKVFYSTHSVNEYEALAWVRKWEQGYVIGLGTKYNRNSLEIRYEKGNGMSGYDGLTSRTDRISFLIGYRF